MPVRQRRCVELQQQLETLRATLGDIDEPIPGFCPVEAQCEQAARDWFQAYQDAGCEIQDGDSIVDRWFALLVEIPPIFHEWATTVFIDWGQRHMPDLLDSFEDGEVAGYMDSEFAGMLKDLPIYQLQCKIAEIRCCLRHLEAQEGADVPHRPIAIGTANHRERTATYQKVPSLFLDQETWQADLARVEWDHLEDAPLFPLCTQIRPLPVFLVVHLFSGRRRCDDFHQSLLDFARLRRFQVHVLSVDTATSVHCGDLTFEGVTWSRLSELYLRGAIAATLAGPPCETWSAARYQRPEGITGHWPRPLRDAARLWGLPGLSHRELTQCQFGSEFVLQVFWTAACHLVFGGAFLGEHPGLPGQPHYASIWKTAIARLLIQHPDCELRHVSQWEWSCDHVKPTGLLAVRLPSIYASMQCHKDPTATKPQQGAIGKRADGSFATSHLKEYPPRFGQALARAISDRFEKALREHHTREVSPLNTDEIRVWFRELSRASLQVSRTGFLPDYQG